MKNLMTSILGPHMTALFFTAVLASSVAAGQAVPFKGSVQAEESYDIQGTTLFVDTTGTGVATHLGLFSVTWEFTVNLLNGAGIGSAHFIAANGDSIFTESLGQGDPTIEDPAVTRVVETHTITGGTGRFAGATGGFTLERLVNMTGITAGSFSGSIVIHKGK